MKKHILGLVLLSTLILGQSNALATKEVSAEQVTGKKEEFFKEYSLDKEKINTNGSGKISLGKLNGVELEGKFLPIKNEFIDVQADGTYVGLKSGKTKLSPVVELSDKTIKELEKQQTRNVTDEKVTKRLSLEPFDLEVSNRKQEILTVESGYTITKVTFKEKENSQIVRNDFKGTKLTGEYKPVTNEFVSLKTDGTLTGIKKGKTTVDVAYTLSSNSEKELKEAYIKELKQPGLTIDDITIVDKDKTGVASVEVLAEEVKQETIDVPIKKEYTLDKSTVKVGEETRVSVKPINGINVTGEFVPVSNEMVSFDKDGRVTTTKAGTVEMKPEFTLSDKSKQELKVTYIKDSGRNDLNPENINLVESNQSENLKLVIQPKEEDKVKEVTVDVTPTFNTNKQNLKVGETGGRVTVAPLHGIEVKGKFKPVKNPLIDFKEDGTFLGLQAGTVELVPTFEIAQETLDAIADSFLKQEKYAHLTRDDVKFTHRDIAQIIPIKFASTTPPTNTNNGGKTAKDYVPVQERRTLPQTGEKNAALASVFGMFLMIGTAVIFKKRNN